MNTHSLVSIEDYSKEEILEVLKLASEFEANPNQRLLEGKVVDVYKRQELIAQHPSANRDECRLMVVDRKTGTIEHKVFKDVIDYFDEKDVFVFNDTKVFPARLYGNKEKTGAEIEVFLLRELNRDLRIWDVLVDPARKIRIGNKLYFGEDDSVVAEVIDNKMCIRDRYGTVYT